MRCICRWVRAGIAIAFALGLASCAHRKHSSGAANIVDVNATNGSAFVVRSQKATQPRYELRDSVKLEITPFGELVPGEDRFLAGLVLPVAQSIHCRVSANGEVLFSKGDNDWTVIGRLPVFVITDANTNRRLSQSECDRLATLAEYGSVEPVEFVVLCDAKGPVIIRVYQLPARPVLNPRDLQSLDFDLTASQPARPTGQAR